MKICGVVAARNIDELIEAALESKAGIVELRLDTLREPLPRIVGDLGHLIEDLRGAGKKTIITMRDYDEGGHYKGSPSEKASIFLKLAEYEPHFIDIELKGGVLERIAHRILSAGTGLIVSLHDLGKPLTTEQILGVTDSVMESIKGSRNSTRVLVKVIYRCFHPRDELHAMNAVSMRKGILVSFAVGGGCTLSRIAAPLLGAPFTYASEYGGPVVPGQPSVEEVAMIWRLLGAA